MELTISSRHAVIGAETWRTTIIIIKKIQVFINNCPNKIVNTRWLHTINNKLLWERTDQLPAQEEIKKQHWKRIGHTLWKKTKCIRKQALTRDPEGNWQRTKPNNTLSRKSEADMDRMNRNWKEVERIVQGRVKWRMLVRSLCFSMKGNTSK